MSKENGTGALIPANDSKIKMKDTHFDIDINLIRDYLENQGDATHLRLCRGSYADKDTMFAVLVRNGDNLYYTGNSSEELIEHIRPVQSNPNAGGTKPKG